MIEILVDHSYEEDYFVISTISVNVEDASEKARIEKLIEDNNIEGQLVTFNDGLSLNIADLLKVNVGIINIETNEIDLF